VRVVLLLVTLALLGCDDDEYAPPTRAELHVRAELLCPMVTPYFYAITRDGKTSYILGSRHNSVAFDRFPRVVHDKLRAATSVVFELAPTDTTRAEMPVEPLRDELGWLDWRRFERLVGVARASRLEVASPASANILLMTLYDDHSVRLEHDIELDARAAGIPMGGLETRAFQDDMIRRTEDLRLLIADIETESRARLAHQSAHSLHDYCTATEPEDIALSPRLLRAGYSASELDATDDIRIYSRNLAWIPQLETLFAQSGVFVVVGNAHLRGPQGVIELLRQRGFTAERIARSL
jgi:uncharacterized protein YbaP (TraB family)